MVNLFTTAMILAFVLVAAVVGIPDYQYLIPNGRSVEGGNWPGVGHVRPEGRGVRNPFGEDFERYDHKWENICMLDSDGDGISNADELNDPRCEWREGDDDPSPIGVTHPGFPNDEIPAITTQSCAEFVEDPEIHSSIMIQVDNWINGDFEEQFFCQGVDITEDINVVRFDPVLTYEDDHVKEFNLYECDSTFVTDNMTCTYSVPEGCSFIYGYAWESASFCLPDDIALPMFSDKKYFIHVRYSHENATRDQSGLRITYTSETISNLAGVLRLGVSTNELLVPMGESRALISNICPSVCLTRKVENRITLFASRFTANAFATSTYMDIADQNGENMIIVANVPFFDSNIRETTSELSTMVVGTKSIGIYCTYDTRFLAEDLVGGHNLYDNERCQNYVMYYPRIEEFSECRTVVNSRVQTDFTGVFRDGRPTAQCGNEMVDLTTGNTIPACDENNLEDILETVNSISEDCSSCSSSCYERLKEFVESDCVDALGFDHVLSHCADYGYAASVCEDVRSVFEECDGLCAIGMDTIHCNENELCENFSCVLQDVAAPDSPPGEILGLPFVDFFIILGGVVGGIIIIGLFVGCICANKKPQKH